jgi:hypothetical protein
VGGTTFELHIEYTIFPLRALKFGFRVYVLKVLGFTAKTVALELKLGRVYDRLPADLASPSLIASPDARTTVRESITVPTVSAVITALPITFPPPPEQSDQSDQPASTSNHDSAGISREIGNKVSALPEKYRTLYERLKRSSAILSQEAVAKEQKISCGGSEVMLFKTYQGLNASTPGVCLASQY